MFQKTTDTEVTSDDKLWVLLTYIFTPIIPVIILLIEGKKDRPFIKAHNAQALAWGIILWVVAIILSFVVIGACIGALGFPLIFSWELRPTREIILNSRFSLISLRNRTGPDTHHLIWITRSPP